MLSHSTPIVDLTVFFVCHHIGKKTFYGTIKSKVLETVVHSSKERRPGETREEEDEEADTKKPKEDVM